MKSHSDLNETAPETHVIESKYRGRIYFWRDEFSDWARSATLSDVFGGSNE